MMSLNDCAALCVLDQEDIAAIAQYEHVPEIADATLASYIADPSAPGTAAICRAMIGDIRGALDEGYVHHATQLVMALRQFLERNPQAAPGTTLH